MIDDTVTYTAELKLPTLEANLTTYGEILELKHPWFKHGFEAGKDGNQVEVPRFQSMLESKGYKTELKSDDELLVISGSFSVLLVFHYPPFSDSTIKQVDWIFETLGQEVRDSMQAEVDRTMTRSEDFWAKTSQRNDLMRKVDSRYRDGDWFESCKPDDYD